MSAWTRKRGSDRDQTLPAKHMYLRARVSALDLRIHERVRVPHAAGAPSDTPGRREALLLFKVVLNCNPSRCNYAQHAQGNVHTCTSYVHVANARQPVMVMQAGAHHSQTLIAHTSTAIHLGTFILQVGT